MNSSPHKENEPTSKKKTKKGEEAVEKTAKKPIARGQSKSCHQCRQSIFSGKGVVEAKHGQARVKCGQCTRYWCEKCLLNRYGLVLTSLDSSSWNCPFCLKNCNCSICRKKEGKLATGILTPLAKNAGFTSVSQFLTESSDEVAQCLKWKSPEVAATPTTTSNAKRKRVKKQDTEKDDEPKETKKPKITLTIPTHSPAQSEASKADKQILTQNNSSSLPNLRRHGSATHRLRSSRRHTIDHSSYSISFEGTERGQESAPDLDKDLSGVAVRRSLRNRVVLAPSPTENSRLRPRHSRLVSRERTKLITEEADEDEEIFKERISLNINFEEESDSADENTKPATWVKKTAMRKKSQSPPFKDLSENAKKDELLQLKENRAKLLKQQKIDIKQSVKIQRANERKVLRERKTKERVELKLLAREKLRRARSLLKEAQRAKRARERDAEKERRRAELRKILNKKREERQRRKMMTSLRGLMHNRHANVSLIDDTPEACADHDVPSLPSLAPLDVGVADNQVPTFLCVCEFLHAFATPLKLRKPMTSATLAALLKNEKGLADLCWTLLKALAHDYEDLRTELKGPKRDKNIEELVLKHLETSNKNGLTSTDHILLNEGLIILDHLCHQLLETSLIVEYLEKGVKEEEDLRRKLRLKEQEKTREMRETLKTFCEEGSSTESIEAKRNEFASELRDMRIDFKRKVSRCASRQRASPLGRDRFNQFYWNLQSVDGLVVEGEERRSWEIISIDEELKSVKESLWSNGLREHSLLSSLNHISLPTQT